MPVQPAKFNDCYYFWLYSNFLVIIPLLSCRLSLDVKCMLFLVLQSHSLDSFVAMGYKSAERLVEGMATYRVMYNNIILNACYKTYISVK